MKGNIAQPQCGFSKAVCQILEVQGVPSEKIKTYNVLDDPELRDAIKEYRCVRLLSLALCIIERIRRRRSSRGNGWTVAAARSLLTKRLPFSPCPNLYPVCHPFLTSQPTLQRMADDPSSLPQRRVRRRMRHLPRHASIGRARGPAGQGEDHFARAATSRGSIVDREEGLGL